MNVSERAEQMLDEMSGALDGLQGAELELTQDLLRNYCWLSVNIDDLTDQIDSEGTLIEMEKGGANNRHVEFVENPAIKVVHKFLGQKSTLYAKLIKVINTDNGGDDALMAFVNKK